MKKLAIFFCLAYSISWLIWLPLYSQQLLGLTLPQIPFQHGWGAWGPMFASIITTFIFYKKERLQPLWYRITQILPIKYLGIALISPFLLLMVAILVDFYINKTAVNWSIIVHSQEFPDWNIMQFFIYNLIFFGFGEEVGWRGFALPHLQEKYNALWSSIILTLFWALWHAPLFLYRDGYTSMNVSGVIGWTLSLLTGSVLLTWLFNASKGSIFICAVFHSTIDVAFTADTSNQTIVSIMGALITIWGIATVFYLKSNDKIMKQPKSA